MTEKSQQPYCEAQIGGMECGNPVRRWGQQCLTHDPRQELQLPFSTNTGYFNGDMFEDWYNAEPNKEDERLWAFLHNWEQTLNKQAVEKTLQKIRESIDEDNL